MHPHHGNGCMIPGLTQYMAHVNTLYKRCTCAKHPFVNITQGARKHRALHLQGCFPMITRVLKLCITRGASKHLVMSKQSNNKQPSIWTLIKGQTKCARKCNLNRYSACIGVLCRENIYTVDACVGRRTHTHTHTHSNTQTRGCVCRPKHQHAWQGLKGRCWVCWVYRENV